jgi:hypothetical protein
MLPVETNLFHVRKSVHVSNTEGFEMLLTTLRNCFSLV